MQFAICNLQEAKGKRQKLARREDKLATREDSPAKHDDQPAELEDQPPIARISRPGMTISGSTAGDRLLKPNYKLYKLFRREP
ncbi:hypothetical protein GCN74_05385 [Janthinobacterium sp. FT14W]|uniref:hypothetical protein n=1 Tax=Janthinobacterium sp. FT14W TaxID=2654253 RepID=UPI001264D299|nr:hypothetical protein [Janthinobacterium sp. FT14W]KAB8061137.1 hypothetical protein GCN74_05385 [Janthinobacterium sp. FT14W]